MITYLIAGVDITILLVCIILRRRINSFATVILLFLFSIVAIEFYLRSRKS